MRRFHYDKDFIQAVNDWQRGGDHRQKLRRGTRLKELCIDISPGLKECGEVCFRQEAHETDRVWQLLADNCLPESIAAWTIDIGVAKDIKGGVPPAGLQGVIFSIEPAPEAVILNLVSLYADPDFGGAVEELKSQIDGFEKGIGRWAGSQKEVVLELANLDAAAVYCYGGYIGTHEQLADVARSLGVIPEELTDMDRRLTDARIQPGDPWWLSDETTKDVLRRMQPHIERLRERKARKCAGPGD